MKVIARALAMVAVATSAIAAEDNAPDFARLLAGFYAAHQKSSQSGVPDAKQRISYAPYLSPELNKLLADAGAAEAFYAKANPDSPPMMEGDLFSPNFEGITSFRPGPCTEKGRAAQCQVALRYADAHPRPQDKPVEWTDTVALVRTASGWRIDDIRYGGTWDFGNHGTLKAILKDMIATARK